MARSRRASRFAFTVLSVATIVGLGVYLVKGNGKGEDVAPPVEAEAIAAPATPRVEATLTRRDDSPTSPVMWTTADATREGAPTTLPAGRPQAVVRSADDLFALATQKRDAGDLVTARDLLNDALAAGRFDGADEQDARTFIGALNDKIILGTQKFPADAYNKTWKVEPGTVLIKLAKRFDVTAELLCRVNGLSRPDRLRAGVTIKAIQGPFHVVVSKSRFEADVYLGNPGGPGSMYVKTFPVGLGSDGSTPTGTWKVEGSKIVNPVYYSPRGEGVIAADDPKNPLGERWIPLTGIEGAAVGQESYGIHGTIDPDSIGRNMSMGCIRLLHDDIVLLYDLLVEGKSLVKVVD